jgi:hypothetical protein
LFSIDRSELSPTVPVEQAVHIGQGNLFARSLAELLVHLRRREDLPILSTFLQASQKGLFLLQRKKGPAASASPASLQTLRPPLIVLPDPQPHRLFGDAE